MITRRDVVSALAGVPALSAFGSAAAPASADAQSAATPTRAGAGARPELRIEAKARLVMIGDSITDVGRARPIGEGRADDALGRGYVMMVDALLGAVYPERLIRVINMGTSGHTTRDLKGRWQTDVVDLKPDWVSIMIGANDVWRQYDSPRQTEKHVLIDEYERNLVEMVSTTKPLVRGLVLMTPFYLEPNRQDAMRATMDRYSAVVRRVAAAQGVVLVDTQAAFDRLLEVYYPATINWDRVHPNPTGSVVLARAFLSAVGFDWLRGLP
jgi:lysophospholipase L1-like esterase